jgi:hypothetical protein
MQIGKTAAVALGGEATGLAARHEAQILETRTSAGALDRWILDGIARLSIVWAVRLCGFHWLPVNVWNRRD